MDVHTLGNFVVI